MQVLNALQTERSLDYQAIANEIDLILTEYHDGQTHAPIRSSLALNNEGVLLSMPATCANFASMKTITFMPHNPRQDLAAIQGTVTLYDKHSGRPLMMLDGPVVTAQRTAALSLLAVQKLQRSRLKKLLVVGAGVQAKAHILALTQYAGIEEVFISSRTLEKSQQLAKTLAQQRQIPIHAITNLNEIQPQVDLIVTSTTSHQAVISEAVQAHQLVVAVGAFTPAMQEIPSTLVQRSFVVVDTLDGAQEEAGDLIQAGINWQHVQALGTLNLTQCQTHQPRLFKSVGHSLWDLAAARVAFKHIQ